MDLRSINLNALVLGFLASCTCCVGTPVVRRPGADRRNLWGMEPVVPRRFLSSHPMEAHYTGGEYSYSYPYSYSYYPEGTAPPPAVPPPPPVRPPSGGPPAPPTEPVACRHMVAWTVWTKGLGYGIADTLETLVEQGTPLTPEELNVKSIAMWDPNGQVATPNLCEAEQQLRYLSVEFKADTSDKATYDALLDYLYLYDLGVAALAADACGAQMRYVETERVCESNTEAVGHTHGPRGPKPLGGGTPSHHNGSPAGTESEGTNRSPSPDGAATPTGESSLVQMLMRLLGF
mmetsp:Transcript_35994/g.101941  ORF Transcript_35994/g.101941 Transcript_35994/m.101941 type:complete len:290 (-) Transcript_35994:297-1166(-)